MTNKFIAALLVGLFVLPAMAQAPLDYEAMSKRVIPLPKGDPRPLLALAARYGQARGEITGQAADVIREKTGSDAKVTITARRLGDIPDQPGCKKVRLTYTSSVAKPAQSKQPPSIDTSVCPANKGVQKK